MQSDTRTSQPAVANNSAKANPLKTEHTPNMRLQLLQQDIRRNFEDNVRNEENGQRGIIFRAVNDIQILLEPENRRITDIHPTRAPQLAFIKPERTVHNMKPNRNGIIPIQKRQ